MQLEAYVREYESEDSTERMRLEAMKNIKRTIIPVITKVSNILNEVGNSIAPIGTVQVICDKQERKKKNALSIPRIKERPLTFSY